MDFIIISGIITLIAIVIIFIYIKTDDYNTEKYQQDLSLYAYHSAPTRIVNSVRFGGIRVPSIIADNRYTYGPFNESCDLCTSCYICPECPRCKLT